MVMVRHDDFAPKQNQGDDSFLAANPGRTEGADAGMEEMSDTFRREGGELYLPI